MNQCKERSGRGRDLSFWKAVEPHGAICNRLRSGIRKHLTRRGMTVLREEVSAGQFSHYNSRAASFAFMIHLHDFYTPI
jgi:hypothetical protein